MQKGLLILSVVALTSGCTRRSIAVPATEIETASIEGPVIFVTINGEAPDKKPAQHEMPAGRNEVAILYRSYTEVLRCTYEFEAVAGHRYEFVTRANPEPVTLYRLAKENWAFWTRHDPVLPRECVEVQR